MHPFLEDENHNSSVMVCPCHAGWDLLTTSSRLQGYTPMSILYPFVFSRGSHCRSVHCLPPCFFSLESKESKTEQSSCFERSLSHPLAWSGQGSGWGSLRQADPMLSAPSGKFCFDDCWLELRLILFFSGFATSSLGSGLHTSWGGKWHRKKVLIKSTIYQPLKMAARRSLLSLASLRVEKNIPILQKPQCKMGPRWPQEFPALLDEPKFFLV